MVALDLYVPGMNFVFGEADLWNQVAVVSFARLEQRFYHQPQDRDLFLDRAPKESVHELAHTHGLRYCQNSHCVMFFSNSLADTDAKGVDFCQLCQRRMRLKARVGGYPRDNGFSMVKGFIGPQALEYARRISFPRLAGTPGEKQARTFIRGQLETFGIPVNEDNFQLRSDPWRSYRLGLAFAVVIILISWLMVEGMLAFLLSGLVLAFIGCSQRIWTYLWQSKILAGWAGKGESSNLSLYLPAADSQLRPTIYLVSHYDSKSQTYPLPLALGMTLAASSALVILCLAFLAASFGVVTGLVKVFAPASVILLSLLMFQTNGNSSPGALDNAGSVGLLLALVRHFKSYPPRHLNLAFLFLGAEEIGLQGSLSFLDACGKELESKPAYFLNLDGIGGKGRMLLSGGRALLALLKSVAGREKIRVTSIPLLPGLTMDHISFISRGFSAASLFSFGRASFKIHSRADVPSLLQGHQLEKAATLVIGLIKELERGKEEDVSSWT